MLVAIALVLGCKRPGFLDSSNAGDANSAGADSVVPAESDAGAAPSGDARADVIRASRKFLDRESFSAKMVGQGKNPMQIDLEYQAPDRFHMVHLGSGGTDIESIIIGRDMYMKQGTKWLKLTGSLGQTVPQIRQLFDEKGLESVTDVDYVGEETSGDQKLYKYSYRSEARENVPYPFKSRIWVRADDGLPKKVVIDYEDGDLMSLTIIYDYEKAVDIKPPETK